MDGGQVYLVEGVHNLLTLVKVTEQLPHSCIDHRREIAQHEVEENAHQLSTVVPCGESVAPTPPEPDRGKVRTLPLRARASWTVSAPTVNVQFVFTGPQLVCCSHGRM